VSNYFYCVVRREELLYDAERDLSEIGKFVVLVGLMDTAANICCALQYPDVRCVVAS